MIIILIQRAISRLIVITILVCLGFTAQLAALSPEWTGKKAPDFKLTGLDGDHIYQLSAYKGKIVILDFWASWCAPCKKSLPELHRIAKKYTGDLEVLAVTIDDDKDNAIRFVSQNNIELIIPFDAKKEVAGLYDIAAMPSLFVIDRGGVVRAEYSGYTEANIEDIISDIEELR